MKTLFYILFFFPVLAGHSQKVIDVGKNDADAGRLFYSVNGEPFSMAKYVKVVEGSPFFDDSLMKGRLETAEGKIYEGLLLRIDLLENAIHFIARDGREMIVTTPIAKLLLRDSVSGKEYDFVHSSFLQTSGTVEPGWYQVLTSGPAIMYKHILKTMQEQRPYNSATTEQTIRTSGQYFLLANSTFSRVKKLKELPDLLQDKKTELDTYISSQGLSGKLDADYAAVVSYYNGLVKK
jgi:hypothetical protein